MVRRYSQAPVTWEKGAKGNKYPPLTLFLSFHLLLVSPIDKPNWKLQSERAHCCSLQEAQSKTGKGRVRCLESQMENTQHSW